MTNYEEIDEKRKLRKNIAVPETEDIARRRAILKTQPAQPTQPKPVRSAILRAKDMPVPTTTSSVTGREIPISAAELHYREGGGRPEKRKEYRRRILGIEKAEEKGIRSARRSSQIAKKEADKKEFEKYKIDEPLRSAERIAAAEMEFKAGESKEERDLRMAIENASNDSKERIKKWDYEISGLDRESRERIASKANMMKKYEIERDNMTIDQQKNFKVMENLWNQQLEAEKQISYMKSVIMENDTELDEAGIQAELEKKAASEIAKLEKLKSEIDDVQTQIDNDEQFLGTEAPELGDEVSPTPESEVKSRTEERIEPKGIYSPANREKYSEN